jgi:hypothetical protein
VLVWLWRVWDRRRRVKPFPLPVTLRGSCPHMAVSSAIGLKSLSCPHCGDLPLYPGMNS